MHSHLTIFKQYRFKTMKLCAYIVFSIVLFTLSACTTREPSSVHSDLLPLSTVVFPDTGTIAPDWKKENSIIVHINNEPATLHPTNSSSYMRTLINQYIHRTLITYDAQEKKLIPDLLKAVPIATANPKFIAYQLKDSIFWDDGTAVTAEDVYFTFLVNSCPLVENFHAKTYLEALDEISIDKTDNRKCVFKMKGTSVRNIGFTTGFPVLQRRYFDPENIFAAFTITQFRDKKFQAVKYPALQAWAKTFNSGNYGRNPEYIRGLGAYQLKKWHAGQFLVLEKKKREVKNASINTLIFQVIKEPNALTLAFKQQNIDASILLLESVFKDLSADEKMTNSYNFACLNTWLYYYLAMNTRAEESGRLPFFTDKRVRKAMALLTPIDTLIELMQYGKRMVGPVYPENIEYNDSLTPIPYNVQQAIALLDAAGWKDTDGDGIRDKSYSGKKIPFSFDLLYFASRVDLKNLLLLIAESYERVGIKANLLPVSMGLLEERARKHQFDMLFSGCSEDFLPQDFAELWHTQSWRNGGVNYSGFGNAQSDALIDTINSLSTINERIAPSRKLQRIIYDEQPLIFLFRNKTYAAVHKRFGQVALFDHRPYLLLNKWQLRDSLAHLNTH